MKNYIVAFVFLCLGISESSAFGGQDSIVIDEQKIQKKINEIKQKEEPRNYAMPEKDFLNKDVIYSFPEKIASDTDVDVTLIWKGSILFIYTFDPLIYKLKGIVDLK